jgi:hypothetical protein
MKSQAAAFEDFAAFSLHAFAISLRLADTPYFSFSFRHSFRQAFSQLPTLFTLLRQIT